MEAAVDDLLLNHNERRGGTLESSSPYIREKEAAVSTSPRPSASAASSSSIAHDGVYVISGDEADGRADSILHNSLTRVVMALSGSRQIFRNGGSELLDEVTGSDGYHSDGEGNACVYDGNSLEGYCIGLKALLTTNAHYEVSKKMGMWATQSVSQLIVVFYCNLLLFIPRYLFLMSINMFN